MYHWGIYLQCEGRGGCFISQDSNGKHDVLQPRVVKAGRGTGKKTFTINQRRVSGKMFAGCIIFCPGKRLRDKMVERSPWASSVLSFCCLFPWVCSVIWSRAAGWTTQGASGSQMPMLPARLFPCFWPRNASHQKHLPPCDSSSALWFLNRSCRWTRSWMTSWARCRLSWGISPRHRCQGQPPHLSDFHRVPPSEPENGKATGQPHVTLSLFHVCLFLSLGVFSCAVGEMKYSAVVD